MLVALNHTSFFLKNETQNRSILNHTKAFSEEVYQKSKNHLIFFWNNFSHSEIEMIPSVEKFF